MADKKKVFLVVLVLFSSFVFGEVLINEVMYDPGQCPDSKCEWVELFNLLNETVNLEGCYFEEKQLSGNISGEGYLLLVRNEEEFKIHFGEKNNILKISLSLSNSGEVLELTGNCSDSFDYSNYIDLADGNNKTLERNKDGEWKESIVEGGTPGEVNSVHEFSYDYSVLEITELLPNPAGYDNGSKPLGEWIEIYNSGEDPVDISGLILYDDHPSHWLKIAQNNVFDGTIVCSSCYKLIYVNGHYNFNLKSPDDDIKLYSAKSEEGGSLIDEFDYFGSSEGMSWSKVDGEWFLTVPTPGEENNYTEKCDWKINIDMENSIFQTNELDFTISVEREYGFEQNITVKGVIEDIFGEEIKSYTPWTNERVVESYKEVGDYSLNGLDEGAYMIKFEIFDLDCDEANPNDNQVTKLIAINPQYKENVSFLNVETLYLGSDESAEWGDQFTVKVNVYKGEESRYSVQLWAEMDEEKISKTTKLNIYDEYKSYPLTLPVQLEPNCNQEIEDGKALLVLEAFGLRAEEEFLVEDVDEEVCRDYLDYVGELEKAEAKAKRGEAYQLIDLPTEAYNGEVLKVKVQLIGDAEEHSLKVWSYLYRGSKCYSCCSGCDREKERDDNLIEFELGKDEVKQVELLVKLDEEMEEGDYKLKVKLNKDGQKTDKELTESIYVRERVGEEKELNESLCLLGGIGEENEEEGVSMGLSGKKKEIINEIKGVVVYESSSEKAKKVIPYLLVVVFGLLCLVLIFKKI